LPGVPAELKGIFGSSLQPILKELFGAGVFVEKEVLIDCSDESALASVLERVAEDNPGVVLPRLTKSLNNAILEQKFQKEGRQECIASVKQLSY
jgi:molybdopterin-biosynthesis enzyme MoeA-like protein